jgi:predicted DNA-binding protein (UPF0251 family)
MDMISITPKARKLLSQIKSTKKPKAINPKLDELEALYLSQLEGLAVQINQLKEENKRLSGI